MGLRTRAYFIGVLMASFSSMAAALGLGEIKLNSSLNQPLDAEIQLLHVRDLSAREILIGIASPAEFERSGVERTYFVTELKFDLDLAASGGPVVRVTSRSPVREPFVNFVVAAQWPSGKLLREYTLLLDLPVFDGTKAAPVQAAPKVQQERPSAATETRPAPVTRPSPPSPARPTEPEYRSDTYGPVSSNDTLWSIAARVRPDASVSVQQTMLAIQRLNPEAFINDNINLLRRGQVLRIPDKQEIQSMSARDAIREVAQQNNRWNKREDAPERAQLEGSKSFSQTREQSTEPEGRVKLSSSSRTGTSGRGAGGQEEGGTGLAESLVEAQEELDAANRENADIRSRLRSMEEQLSTMERLLQVSNDEMRALELAAQQSNDAEAPADTSEGSSAETQPATAPVAASEPTAAPAPETKPAASKAPVTKSWMDQAIDLAKENILYVGIGAGALLLALLAFLFMRNRKDEFADDYDEGFDGEAGSAFAVADDLNFDQNDKTVPLFDSADSDDEQGSAPTLAEAETEDVVGECDIHIAYGQYDQAEEKLLRALEKDPANAPARLKLMEVYAAQGDAENFDAHYARLRRIGDNETLDRAALLRSTIDGIGEFDESAYDVSDVEDSDTRIPAYADSEEGDLNLTDDTLEFDFDQVDELVDSSAKVSAEDTTLGDLDFDLDLGSDDSDITRIPESSPAASESSEESDLADLEFELGDLDTETSFDEVSLDLDMDDAASRESLPDDDLNFDLESDSQVQAADDLDDLDLELEQESEQLTPEFSSNLVAESGAGDFSADLDDFADLTEEGADLANADEALDFDLDRDLESARSIAQDTDVQESGDESTLTELGLEDLEDLDIDLEDAPAGESADTEVAAKPADDFDVDFDLGGDLNLDQLDQELDQLAPGLDDGAELAGRDMEEPVIDFDEPESGVASESEFALDEPVESFEEDAAVADADVQPESVPELSVDHASEAGTSSSLDFEIPDFDPENDDDSNLDFLSDNDETATKLDLARAYIDMGDADGAKDILDEILDEGNDQQKKEAEALLSRIG
jgi:pilus assembly protein FimV